MAWISALAGAIDSTNQLINTGLNYGMSKKLQDDAQKFYRDMSNTAHQREVNDLRKAGINPLYTATGGSGASSGTAGGSFNGNVDVGSNVGSAFLSGLATLNNIKTQTNATNADVALKGIQGEDMKVQMLERLARIDKMKSDMSLTRYQEHKLEAEIKQVWANIRQLDTLSDLNITNASYISDKNKREKYLTAGEQAASLNRLEQIKSHPNLSYILDYLRGSRYLK